jgi:hypothetical protein
MNILDHLDGSLKAFRPKSQREFVALQLARRFNVMHRLPRYLMAAQRHPKTVLLEAAKTARLRHQLNRTPVSDLFFEVLAEREEGETP